MNRTDQENALDISLSGQSYAHRLIDSACAELNAMAFDLKISHTVNGSWPAGERDTLEKHDHLKRMAVELRRMKEACRTREGWEAAPSVPEYVIEALSFYAKCNHMTSPVENGAIAFDAVNQLLSTTPQPADDWRNAETGPPEMGVPVVGWHPDWVDLDFNPDGTRECFLFGDGTEWNSASWFDEQDCYTTHEGAPKLWHPFPAPPTEGAE